MEAKEWPPDDRKDKLDFSGASASSCKNPIQNGWPSQEARRGSRDAGLCQNNIMPALQRFEPRLFAQAERDRSRARERHRLTTLARVEEQVRQCLAHRPLVRVFLFGSLLRPGCFALASDIDIAIEGLPPSEYFALFAELEDRLQTERLDLIELERCSFAQFIRQTGKQLQ
jgi:uncharacterized protein